jgi:hypothetical protein
MALMRNNFQGLTQSPTNSEEPLVGEKLMFSRLGFHLQTHRSSLNTQPHIVKPQHLLQLIPPSLGNKTWLQA